MKVRSPSVGSWCGRGGGREASISLLLSLGALFYFTLFVESAEGKVRCYVCSWHSPAYGGQNMTDTCSHYNFDETYTRAIECDHGCEAVSIRKSKNENIVNFYKNCKSEDSLSSSDKCTSQENKNFEFVTTCECSSDLCNSVQGTHSSFKATASLSLVILILAFQHNFTFKLKFN